MVKWVLENLVGELCPVLEVASSEGLGDPFEVAGREGPQHLPLVFSEVYDSVSRRDCVFVVGRAFETGSVVVWNGSLEMVMGMEESNIVVH